MLLALASALIATQSPSLEGKVIGLVALIEQMPDLSKPSNAKEIEAQCTRIARFDTKSIDLAMHRYLRPLNIHKAFAFDEHAAKTSTSNKAMDFYQRSSQVSHCLTRFLFATDSPEGKKQGDMWPITFPSFDPDFPSRSPVWPWAKDKSARLHFVGDMSISLITVEGAIYGPQQDFEQAEKLPRRPVPTSQR